MLEIRDRKRRVVIATCIGIVLAGLSAFGGVLAALGGWLAQPAFALACRWWNDRETDASRTSIVRIGHWRRDIIMLSILWGAGLVLVAGLLAWPLGGLLANGGIGSALAVGVVAGACLLGLWRSWPLWQALEGSGGTFIHRWQSLKELDTGVWRGLGAAALLATAMAGVVLLAWPGLLSPPLRWVVAALFVIVWPLLHWRLQAVAPAQPLPLVELIADNFEDEAPEAALDTLVEQPELDAALYSAARRGRVERALELLDAGANAHAAPCGDERDKRTLAVLAAVLPDLRLLRELIARGVQVNAVVAGMTPLLAATRDSWHGRPEAVMTLLANGADPRAADADGNTPLHHAARSSDPGVAALLRDAAAELDACNHEGMTPLGVACAAGNWRLARFLLERGASAQPANEAGSVPPLLAAADGDEDDPAGVLLLIKHKAKVEARDSNQRSALHVAALAGHVEIVDILLAAGADANARDAQARTPWLDAARGGHLPVLERLLAAQPQLDALDQDGRNALALACIGEFESLPLVRQLLDAGLDPNLPGNDGKSAIKLAAEAGHWHLVTAMDPAYPLPAAVAEDDLGETSASQRTPSALLRDGLRSGHFDGELDALARLLSPAQLGALLVDPEQTPSVARIEWLLGRGADPEIRDERGDTPVFALLGRGAAAAPALGALLRHGISPSGRGGLARFLDRCLSEQGGAGALETGVLEGCALELLERGVDPDASTSAGDPPLALAVRLGWPRFLQQLITRGVWLDVRNSHGMTPLHLAAALGREQAVKQLILHGARPDQRAADGQTPLGVALSAGRRDLADWLDWRGWALPGRALRPADLPAAAIVGDADGVRRLLDLGLALDAVDNQGCTALLRASGGGHGKVVDLLLARGADPQFAAHTGATPLSAAVSMRQGDIVDRLLAAGANLEQRLPGDVTVLMLAAALGLPDLAARLLTAGADVDANDAQGLTPLHCAALYGFTARERPRLVALFDTLLLAGAEPDASTQTGVTPLLLLLGARAEPGTACDVEVLLVGLERLLDEEVKLDARDQRGFGALHLSALHGLSPVVERLLRAGADPDQRDALNRSPREIAVMRGFVDVAAQLGPSLAGGAPSMARFLREPK